MSFDEPGEIDETEKNESDKLSKSQLALLQKEQRRSMFHVFIKWVVFKQAHIHRSQYFDIDQSITPASDYCLVCDIDYDILGTAHNRTEFKRDVVKFLNKKMKHPKFTEKMFKFELNEISQADYEFYYHGLQKSIAIKLFHFYNRDFLNFGFKIEDIIWSGFRND